MLLGWARRCGYRGQMSNPAELEVEGVHPLPPLILHPFTTLPSTDQALENTKALLSLTKEKLGLDEKEKLLRKGVPGGRYAEFRMLFYVGKDVCRWIEQCVDACRRSQKLEVSDLTEQSFAHLLVEQTPTDIAEKLKNWGVLGYSRIFSRSIGLYVQFRQLPPAHILQVYYLHSYSRYADHTYTCWRDSKPYVILPQRQFPFSLYASGEYTDILEEEWKDVAK